MTKKIGEFIDWGIKISWESFTFLLSALFQFIVLCGAATALFFLYKHYPEIFIEYLLILEPVFSLIFKFLQALIYIIAGFLIAKMLFLLYCKKEDKNGKRRKRN
jgi:hypothetical protein